MVGKASNSDLAHLHPGLWQAMCDERQRQHNHIELIASENYASPAVISAMGSVLTNKYAEGYPGKRYYGGCEHVDVVEQIAIDQAKALFGASYVNVQPHSGSQANAAVYLALLKPGDCILGLDLAHGGHLTHGSPVNFSGKIYRSAFYQLDDQGLLDMDHVADVARRERPRLIVAGYSAYSRTIDWAAFRAIADEVGAYLHADMAHVAGLIAADLYPSPLPHAHVVTTTTHKTLRGPRGGMILCGPESDLNKALQSSIFPGLQGGPLMHVIAAKAAAFTEARQPSFQLYQQQVIENAQALAAALLERGYHVVSGGTDTHLMLVDLRDRDFTGKDAEQWLERAGMTTNKNAVPGDQRSPFQTSGLRLGTPAMTTRGFEVEHMHRLASWIDDMLSHLHDEAVCKRVAAEVQSLCDALPVYPQD